MMNFEWDPIKAERNWLKHGVRFTDAALVFADPLNVTLFDEWHSIDEERWITMGRIVERILVVVHTFPKKPSDEPIRIISARVASALESRYYMEGDKS